MMRVRRRHIDRVRRSVAARLASIAVALAIAAPARGQTLELTRAASRPEFPVPSAVASLIAVLEREAAELAATADDADRDRARSALSGKVAVRRLAAELLASGDRAAAGPAGDDDVADDGVNLVLKGLKLAAGRRAIDLAIDLAAAPDDGVTTITDASRRAAMAAVN
jgi:hypothetical protein